ncbi:transcription repressor OFP4-like [Andrographis paniculata]|uniref:transcription repressor OFP4-like n=1 Tax=Andrographis paniculata TaxID=175694 RepID=UPI0021E8077F|nr:transcription repressor OFP4-like [Andrographis paniculata]
MGKAKIPILRLPFLNNVQICRPKNPFSMVKAPPPPPTIPADYFSPFSSTITLPSFADPPSTPDNLSMIKHRPLLTKTSEVSSKPYTKHGIKSQVVDDLPSHEYYSKTRKPGKSRFSNSTFPSDNLTTKTDVLNHLNGSKDPSEIVSEDEPLNRTRRSSKPRRFRSRRFKGFGSKDWDEETKTAPEPNRVEKQKPVSRRATSRTVDKSVSRDESFVVVKRSDDPYKDFKKSMLDMIIERRMFDPKDLEQLLMSFLSLNSTQYHRVILQAFAEILNEAFSSSSRRER